MRLILAVILLAFVSGFVFGQAGEEKAGSGDKKEAEAEIRNDKEEFRKAAALVEPRERADALARFVSDFPESAQRTRALELLTSARAQIADKLLGEGKGDESAAMFSKAVSGAPEPISDKLFDAVLLKIPSNLFWRGERKAAVELAGLIEKRVASDPRRLIALAGFHIAIENASEARRLAKKAIGTKPDSVAAYQILGVASRMDFDLRSAADAYGKALELDGTSNASRIALADTMRALGRPAEAIELYRKVLEANGTDGNARTGLALALFDAGKVSEAQLELQQSLIINPRNLPLLVGAAYWYAAHQDADRSIRLANAALAIEPRYTWAYIALARGLSLKNDPMAAERALLAAKRFGSFPTLDYELAAVRYRAGFFFEAAEGLKKDFRLKDGVLETSLGGRVFRRADNFVDLIAPERQAGIFQPVAADDPKTAESLKSLLLFALALELPKEDEAGVLKATDGFVAGGDKMKTHREIFAADQLIKKRRALPKVLELMDNAVGGVSASLDVVVPAAAVLADELYESRTIAIKRGTAVIVPEIPESVLENILRGRIEELSGRALLAQGRTEEAAVRMKRALTVLPEDSAWWRSAMWRMGSILESQGKTETALDRYITSYQSGGGNPAKRAAIEGLYTRIHGDLEGLDKRLSERRKDANATASFLKKDEDSPDGELVAKKVEGQEDSTDKAQADPVETPKEMPEVKQRSKPDEPEGPAGVDPQNTAQKPEGNKDIKVEAKAAALPAEQRDSGAPKREDVPAAELSGLVEGLELKGAVSVPQKANEKTDRVSRAAGDAGASGDGLADRPKEKEVGPEKVGQAGEGPDKPRALSPEEKELRNETLRTTRKRLEAGVSAVIASRDGEKGKDPSEKANVEPVKEKAAGTGDPAAEPRKDVPGETSKSKDPDPTRVDDKKDPVAVPKDEGNRDEQTPTEDPAVLRTEEGKERKTSANDGVDAKNKNSLTGVPKNENRPEAPSEDPVKTDPSGDKAEIKRNTEATDAKPADDKISTKDPPKTVPRLDSPSSTDLGATRPRVFSAKTKGKAEEVGEIPACTFVPGQREVSIASNGGSVGLLTGVEGKQGAYRIKAVSSSPEDLRVTAETLFPVIPGKALFLIRSVSDRKGFFNVTFETPCGRHSVRVNIR